MYHFLHNWPWQNYRSNSFFIQVLKKAWEKNLQTCTAGLLLFLIPSGHIFIVGNKLFIFKYSMCHIWVRWNKMFVVSMKYWPNFSRYRWYVPALFLFKLKISGAWSQGAEHQSKMRFQTFCLTYYALQSFFGLHCTLLRLTTQAHRFLPDMFNLLENILKF